MGTTAYNKSSPTEAFEDTSNLACFLLMPSIEVNMYSFFRSSVSVLSVFLLFGIAGCSTENVAVQKIPENADPAAEILNMEQKLEQAKSEQLPALSPENFSKSERFLSEAKKAWNRDHD